MIGEAVDAVLLVADALAVWVLVGAVAGTSVVYAAVVGGWLIWRGVRRTIRAAIPRRGLSAPISRPEPASQASGDAGTLPGASWAPLSVSPLQTRPNRSKP